jgi:biotin-(acetyl-CoA carboxylase) ligase
LVGIAIDVDSDGALILETEDGKRKRVVAGDIEYKSEMSNVKACTE